MSWLCGDALPICPLVRPLLSAGPVSLLFTIPLVAPPLLDAPVLLPERLFIALFAVFAVLFAVFAVLCAVFAVFVTVEICEVCVASVLFIVDTLTVPPLTFGIIPCSILPIRVSSSDVRVSVAYVFDEFTVGETAIARNSVSRTASFTN